LRQADAVGSLGQSRDGRPVTNHANFPAGDVEEPGGEVIFEIPNPFPFRGTTFILKTWADAAARNPAGIELPEPESWSFSELLRQWSGADADGLSADRLDRIFRGLPEPLQLSLAATSTDPEDLTRLAALCCDFVHDPSSGRPLGLVYETDKGAPPRAVVRNHLLFDALANNACLPDDYKQVMVLRPGAQGGSEITGDWRSSSGDGHVFEYLRRNSYIPWGHYAANMADDAIRYRIEDLSPEDVSGMRHLYYQRTYVRVARELGVDDMPSRRPLSPEALERLRLKILSEIRRGHRRAARLAFTGTLWGWNFGFDFSPSRYRLHASHQQIHQQYALVPADVSTGSGIRPQGGSIPAYCCGDLIRDFIRDYRESTGRPFFEAYIEAIRRNRRVDGRNERERSLVVYEDERVMVFVPKAQTSQWELQLMTIVPAGNILETDSRTRECLDRAILVTMKVLTAMGARMITVIEYAKRFDGADDDHRLLYAFLPRLPQSPGAFSEAQLRWIIGHYPEDFAAACRRRLPQAADNK
jgi:hypothetical protein